MVNIRSKKKKKRVAMVIIVCIVLIAAALIMIYISRNAEKDLQTAESSVAATDLRVIGTMDYERKYEMETHYQGDLDNILYAYPFGKTDEYVSNKDLYNELSDEFKKMMQEKATEYFKTMYDISPKQLAINYDSYVDAIAEQFESGSNSAISMDIEGEDVLLTPVSYASYLAEKIIDSNLQMDVGVKTGDSMIFKDGSYKIRCLVTVKFYACDDISAIEELFGISNAVIDVSYPLIYDISIENEKITGSELVNVNQYAQSTE